MRSIYRITFAGIAITAVIAVAAAKVMSADAAELPGSHIDIGNPESEAGVIFTNASDVGTITVGENTYDYRTLDKDGSIEFTVPCSPDRVNYVTVRLWGGDTGDTILWLTDPAGNMSANMERPPARNAAPVDRRDWVELNYVSATPQYSGGFIYSTYELPVSYTKGKNEVPLKIYSTGGPSNYSANPVKEQTELSRGIYDIYVGQEAAFDPYSFGVTDGGYDAEPADLYSIEDEGAMAGQREALKNAVFKGIEALKKWQIYGDDAPSYMQGMITRTDWRLKLPESDSDWKNSFYNDKYMLKQNLTPLNMIELAAIAYENAGEFGLNEADKAELLDRVIAAVDFLCRAQGSNGGFFSDHWIGGPARSEASGNNLTGFGLRSAGSAILKVSDALTEDIRNERIDSDADGEPDTARAEAWIAMLSSARDFLIRLDGGYGHAPNQDMANSIAAMRFDLAIGRLGGSVMSKRDAGAIIEREYGMVKNPVTSSYWVSPKGTILENFGSMQGGYSGDYGSAAIVEMAELAELSLDYGYGVRDYGKYMGNVYNVIDNYYFTGVKLVNGELLPQQYTEGLISNRNAYYPGTERYPVDIYSALKLNNDTALKIIYNYFVQQDIAAKLAKNGELNTANVHFEDNALDAAKLYLNFNDLREQMMSRVTGYEFVMEDDSVTEYAWADEMARNVVIKDVDSRLYFALNWRNPAHTINLYNTVDNKDRQRIMANNLCRVHATNSRYDSYGYADMYTDGYRNWTWISDTDGSMEAFMCVNYGDYTIVMNSYNCGGNGTGRSFTGEEIAAAADLDTAITYKDMISGNIYSYSGGQWHSGGTNMKLDSASTLVLKAQKISASVYADENGAAHVHIRNNLGTQKQISVYAASHQQNGELSEVKIRQETVPAGESDIVIEDCGGKTVYVWDDTMKPVTERTNK